ncbi:peptide ABC transporter ATP-binding protein [Paenibacillus sambharensis]|uniref:Peptide ABC transporter ATP-binding protein n=1 Tax=Paenibacillus sambharensis TaxID=1803190 RepID=A0A2W1LPI0_9BACL|nr:ABC transporter ATP-binding protein [Paenibacillus sambharensis]PZD96434.1 peptide ABC transporter ATP-binding protein [Paenibacillus sambharensis]
MKSDNKLRNSSKGQNAQPLLEVEDLHVSFDVRGGEVQAVRGVNMVINKGEVVGIVGESGCGKSVTAQTLMRLIPSPPSRVKKGSIRFAGEDVLKKSEKEMQQLRGGRMGMIFQDPMTSLNPTMTVGRQITENLIRHRNMSMKEAHKRGVEMLNLVGIPLAETRMKQYPHEFSGGMRQRVMIAIALACDPELLIADEPTTALDVTIQAQILEVMKELRSRLNTSIMLITHDLGIVADVCDKVIVMYAGQVAETGTVHEIFTNPKHPYTQGLLESIPRLDDDKSQPLVPIPGTPPDLIKPPTGCAFAARCKYTMDICTRVDPGLFECSSTQSARCWLNHEMAKEVHA